MIRLARILLIALRFRLYRFLPHLAPRDATGAVADPDRAVRLRQALETLGPIFVKFGQVLSTRRDLLPLDIADELAKLQDEVPPFAVRTADRLRWRSLLVIANRGDAVAVRDAGLTEIPAGTITCIVP